MIRKVLPITVLAFVLVVAALFMVPVAAAQGPIVFDGSPGTAAPPPTLGPYSMTPFPADGQPTGPVTAVAGPTGPLGFDQSVDHTTVGAGWATWSHGYTGDVYT